MDEDIAARYVKSCRSAIEDMHKCNPKLSHEELYLALGMMCRDVMRAYFDEAGCICAECRTNRAKMDKLMNHKLKVKRGI